MHKAQIGACQRQHKQKRLAKRSQGKQERAAQQKERLAKRKQRLQQELEKIEARERQLNQ